MLMDPNAPAEPLNERFAVKNGFLQTVSEQVFQREPSAMLELFLLLQDNPELSGVSAYTIGSIKRHLHLIDDEFRQNPRNHRLFLNILRAKVPQGAISRFSEHYSSPSRISSILSISRFS